MTSSSSSLGPDATPILCPLKNSRPKGEKKTDWLWVASIVAAAIGGAIAALGYLSLKGDLPAELFGGPPWELATFLVGASILAPAACIILDKWWLRPDQPA